MKVLCIADAYVTSEMMREGVQPYLTREDTLIVCFFGENDRTDMRDTVKAIEAMQRDRIPVSEDIVSELADSDIVIVHLCPVTRKMIEQAPQLKAILSCRGGTENIDVRAATDHHIMVTANPAHNANAVAEYTIGLILCETRNIARADASLKKGIWREKYPNTETTIRELKDMTVGIIGFGSVGRLVAERLKVFGCRILINTPHPSENAYDLINFKFVDLPMLLRESDVVSLHARTKAPIIGADEFTLMKPTAYLINTARSVLVESNALENAMKNHQILGAAIDVFETEPVIPEFYKKYDNITITNHRGGDTINSYKDAPEFAIRNYFNYLNGEQVRFWVNREDVLNESIHIK